MLITHKKSSARHERKKERKETETENQALLVSCA